MDIKKLKKSRTAFLRKVYEKSNVNIHADVDVRDIQKEMKLTPQELSAITSYLIDEKLITDENTATYEHVFITSGGINFLEEQMKENNIFKQIEKHPFVSFMIFLLTGIGALVAIITALRDSPEQKKTIVLSSELVKPSSKDSLNPKKESAVENKDQKVYFYIDGYTKNDPLVKAVESLNKACKFKIDAATVFSINVDGDLQMHDDGTCSYTGEGNILIFKNEKYCADTGYEISLDSINSIDIPCSWHEEALIKRVDKKVEAKRNAIAQKLAECIND